jgi:hypothetical protein
VCSRRVSSPRFCLPVKINFELVVLASAQRVHVFSVRELIEVVKKKKSRKKNARNFCREKKNFVCLATFFFISQIIKQTLSRVKRTKKKNRSDCE